MSPVNDSFMSGSLDHSIRMWDLRVNACQVGLGILIFYRKLINNAIERKGKKEEKTKKSSILECGDCFSATEE